MYHKHSVVQHNITVEDDFRYWIVSGLSRNKCVILYTLFPETCNCSSWTWTIPKFWQTFWLAVHFLENNCFAVYWFIQGFIIVKECNSKFVTNDVIFFIFRFKLWLRFFLLELSETVVWPGIYFLRIFLVKIVWNIEWRLIFCQINDKYVVDS